LAAVFFALFFFASSLFLIATTFPLAAVFFLTGVDGVSAGGLKKHAARLRRFIERMVRGDEVVDADLMVLGLDKIVG
jgi:hypothetical protein